jgi:hypothetical protein
MSIVIEFTPNTNYEIQIWKIKNLLQAVHSQNQKEQNIKSPKNIIELNMLKPKNKLNPKIECFVEKTKP